MKEYREQNYEIGVCCPCNKVDCFREYDFVELPAKEIMKFDDKSFSEYARKMKENRIIVKSVNCLFDKNVSLYESNPLIIHEYINKLARRLNILGCEKIVLGSGKCRRIPDGVTKKDFLRKFNSVLKDILDICGKLKIYLLLEYLSVETCNFMNSFSEAYEIVRLMDNKWLGIVVDLFHSNCANENLNELIAYQDCIKHIHVCTKDRNAPGSNSENFDALFEWLEKFDNKPTISIEVNEIDTVIRYSSLDILKKL